MQKWLMSVDIEKWNPTVFFVESGFVDYKKRNNYEIGDIVYIYCKQPIGIMFKTYVKMISNDDSNENLIRFHLIEYSDNDDLSLENLKKHGLLNPTMDAMKLNGELEQYIDNCFADDLNINDKNHKLWIINAGEKGIKLPIFLKHNFIGIGSPFVDLTDKDRDEIKLICENGSENSSNCLYKADAFVNQIKVGDYILTKNFSNNEYIIGRCISNYYYSEIMDDSKDDIKYNHCRDVIWLDITIKREDFSKKYLKYIDTPKSLQEIKNDGAKNEILNFYNFNFLCNQKRNMIYFGARGTGKSYILNQNIKRFLKKYKKNIGYNYERVTFHPDYSYSNFVGTYKPIVDNEKITYKHVIEQNEEITYKPVIDNNEITYKFVPGPFMRILIKALSNPYEPFILIIEEINRANVAAVFGDVFQLLDRNKLFNSEFSINASEDMKKYIKNNFIFPNIPKYRFFTFKDHLELLFGENFEKITIPSNMFIWATMNSADQGVFPMDTAFKRRWDFEYLGINDGEEKIKNLKVKLNDKEISWNNIRRAINKELVNEYGINEDKLIGPFFAFNEYIDEKEPSIEIPNDKFKEIFKNKIIMYLFEDVARSRRNELFNGVKKNSNLTYSQICQKFEKDGMEIFCKGVVNNLD